MDCLGLLCLTALNLTHVPKLAQATAHKLLGEVNVVDVWTDGSRFSEAVLEGLWAGCCTVKTVTGLARASSTVIASVSLDDSLPTPHIGNSILILQEVPEHLPQQAASREIVVISNATTVLRLDKKTSTFINLFPSDSQDPLLDASFRRIIVSTFNCSIFSMFGPIGKNGRPDKVEGLELALWVEMAKRLKLEWTLSPTNGFGGIYPNGSWTPGVHTDLIYGSADIAFCSIWLYNETLELLRPIAPWHLYCLRFLVPRPTLIRRASWSTLFRTYTAPVWAAFCLSTLLTALFYRIIIWANPLTFQYSDRFSLWKLTWEVALTVTQSEYSNRGLRPAVRPLVLFWAFGSLLYSTGYSSKLVSVLTMGSYSGRITTIQDMVDARCYWGLNTYKDNDYLYKNSEEKTHKAFRSLYLGTELTLDEKGKLMTRGCYAELVESAQGILFLTTPPPPYFYDNHEPSDLCLDPHLYGMTVRKGSVLGGAMELVTLRMREAGLENKIIEDTGSLGGLGFKYKHPPPLPPPVTPITLQALQAPLYLLTAGLVLASLVLLAELIYSPPRH